jgi:hypothetical protein
VLAAPNPSRGGVVAILRAAIDPLLSLTVPKLFASEQLFYVAMPSFYQVGRPWLHWPECGVTSISRSSAFISASDSIRPPAPIRARPSSPRPHRASP